MSWNKITITVNLIHYSRPIRRQNARHMIRNEFNNQLTKLHQYINFIDKSRPIWKQNARFGSYDEHFASWLENAEYYTQHFQFLAVFHCENTAKKNKKMRWSKTLTLVIFFGRVLYIFLSLFLSDMSTVSSNDLNLKLWYAARDGESDAVLAAIVAGADANWKNDSHVSDNSI